MPSRVKRLASLSAFLTFLLILVGGIVRLSDSGLGCGPAGSGTHGWPLCNGKFFPLANGNTIIEYSHRALAGLVTVFVVLLLIAIWRQMRSNRRALQLTWIALGTVLIQAVLGGLTVEENLHELLVGVHLALAMALLALLLAVRRAVDQIEQDAIDNRLLKGLVIATVISLLITIGAGGYVAGTQGHGRASESLAGAHMACGNTFPVCNGKFLPFNQSRLTDIHLTHRLFMYIASLLIVAVFAYSIVRVRRRRVIQLAAVGLAILIVQIVLGGMQVWVGEEAWLVFLHLLVGTVLWSWSVLFLLQFQKPSPITA